MIEKYNTAKLLLHLLTEMWDLCKDDGVNKTAMLYQSIISWEFAVCCHGDKTRSQAVGLKFSAKPTEAHLTAAKGNIWHGIEVQEGRWRTIDQVFRCWFCRRLDGWRSTSSHVFFMSSGLDSWCCKKQLYIFQIYMYIKYTVHLSKKICDKSIEVSDLWSMSTYVHVCVLMCWSWYSLYCL